MPVERKPLIGLNSLNVGRNQTPLNLLPQGVYLLETFKSRLLTCFPDERALLKDVFV